MKIFTFPSRTGGNPHTTTLHNDGNVTCTCRGYDTPQHCWHYRTVLAEAALPIDDLDFFTPWSWIKDKPLEKVIDGFIDPMLASERKEGLEIEHYMNVRHVLEPKFDGHRRILQVHENGTYFAWARSGAPHTLPAHLVPLVAKLAPGTYDAELYFPGGTSTDVTAITKQSRLRLALFDILKVGQRECMFKPAAERREMLEVATGKIPCQEERLHTALQLPVSREALDRIYANGGEGAIVKKTDAIYYPGRRVATWIKFKKPAAAEVTITGFEEGSLGPHAKILAVDAKGIKVRVKSLNDAWRADFAINWKSYIGRTLVIVYYGRSATGKYIQPHAEYIVDAPLDFS